MKTLACRILVAAKRHADLGGEAEQEVGDLQQALMAFAEHTDPIYHDAIEEKLSDILEWLEFNSIEECEEAGVHLKSVDDDGYCNACGYQETSDDSEEDDEG